MNVILLGVGHWHADMHARAVQGAGAALHAVWDLDAATGASFASRHGMHAASDPASALMQADLAVVMGHPSWVPELARTVIAAGVPMILEKPAASDTRTLAQLAGEVVAANLFAATPLPNRLGPVMIEYERLSASGSAGPVAHAHFRIVNGPPDRYRADGVSWMLDPEVSGGGALRNLGIHGIDCALHLAGGALTPAAIHIENRIHQAEAVEDYALVTLTGPDGAVYTVEAGYSFASRDPGGDFEWRIATANAYLVDHGLSAGVSILDSGQRRPLSPIPPGDRYTAFMRDTLDRLVRKAAPSVSLSDYVAAMRLIDTLYDRAGR